MLDLSTAAYFHSLSTESVEEECWLGEALADHAKQVDFGPMEAPWPEAE